MAWNGESRRHSLARKGIRTSTSGCKAMGKRQRYLKNSNGKRVYTGKVSEQILMFLLDKEHDEWVDYYLDESGYFQEGDMWTAWDNSDGLLSVENFWMKENARSWAVDLGTTPTEMHNKDNKDVFRAIADEVREEELILYEQTNFTDEIEKDLMKLVDDHDNWYLSGTFMNDVARILQRSRDEESELFEGDTPHITNIFVDEVGDRFKDSKALKRSRYWSIFS